MATSNLWLVLRNSDTKRTWTKYFSTEDDMNSYIKKIRFLKNLFIIEDSRDIVFI